MSDQLSDSSLSRMSPVPSNDLSVKYQKIASEYSKIRAHATVLKKAFLDEQAKNVELQEILREKEQNLRKTDQEMESLTFRNQQLTKRVEFLQEELEQCQNSLKKSSSKGKPSNSQRPGPEYNNHVLDMEFKKMVEENAQLLSKMYDSEEEHKQEMISLNEQIDRLQRELNQHGKQTCMAEEKLKTIIQKLDREKSELYETIKLHEQHLKSLTEELVNLNKYKLETIPQLEAALLIIATYLPFIDTSDPKLSLRSIENEEQTVYFKVKKEMENLVLYFSLLFSCLKKRLLLIHSDSITFPSDDLSVSLSINNEFVFDKSSELSSLISPLFLKFKKPSKLLLPLFVQSLLNEEKQEWGCRQANQELSKSVNEFLQLFMKISYFVEISMSSTEIQETKSVNQSLLNLLHSLLDAVTGIKMAYGAKEQAEKRILLDDKLNHKLLNIESELQTVNSCCVHLLTSLTLSLQMLLSLLQELNLANVSENLPVSDIDKGAPRTETKAHLQSHVQSLKGIISAEEGDVWKRLLLEQLDNARKKITELEMEKNRVLIDCQMKLNSLEPLQTNTIDNIDSRAGVDSNLIGSLESPFSIPQEMEAREERLEKYFTNQLNSMVVKNQEALSKADTFSIECGVLQRRLELSSDARRESERKLIESNETLAELNEKLQSTKQNYEMQLSTMSDHLANMGDKLTKQTEQLELLNVQLNNARKKK